MSLVLTFALATVSAVVIAGGLVTALTFRLRSRRERTASLAERRRRAKTYLRTLTWLESVRRSGEIPGPETCWESGPVEAEDLASISAAIAASASSTVRRQFEVLVDSLRTHSDGAALEPSHRSQIILIAGTMADEIDNPPAVVRRRRLRHQHAVDADTEVGFGDTGSGIARSVRRDRRPGRPRSA